MTLNQPVPLTPLKRLRLERRIDRYKVAQKIGVSDKTLGRWEEGLISPPLDDATKLADFYQVTLDELAGRTLNTAA